MRSQSFGALGDSSSNGSANRASEEENEMRLLSPLRLAGTILEIW